MTLVMAIVFYGFVGLLAISYGLLVHSAKKRSSRLNLNHPELADYVVSPAGAFQGSGDSEERAAEEWQDFILQYAALFVLLGLCAGFWMVWQSEVSAYLSGISGSLRSGLVGFADVVLPFPVWVLFGLLPAWFLCKALPQHSVAYPFVAFHIVLVSACCAADIIGANAQLNPIQYSESAFRWIIFYIIFSHSIWAISYPNPIKSVPLVCWGLVFSLSAAFFVFVFINLFSDLDSPTIVAFTVYISFGYGVFGTHLWSLSIISQAST